MHSPRALTLMGTCSRRAGHPLPVLLLVLVLVLLLPLATPAYGQEPDRRGEIATDSPTYRGVRASASIDPKLHVRNEGGSDGSGLCVISAVLSGGMAQGVPGFDVAGYDEHTKGLMPGKGSAFWRTAKSRPGGYSPDKLAALIKETVPEYIKWVSYVGTDASKVEGMTKQGLRVAATMNTGQQYRYAYIHHFVNYANYKVGSYACIIDNNDPGKFHWMPTIEATRRLIDGSTLWAFAWLYNRRSYAIPILLSAAALTTAAGGVLILSRGQADGPDLPYAAL